jgi:hypothetical protein
VIAFAVALALAAEPAPIKLAAPGLEYVNLADDVGAFYSEHLAHQLQEAHVRVITARQISTLLGFERQKQLLGCSDNASCIAELANALGVDGIVTGQLGKFDDLYQLDIKIIGAVNGRILSAYSGQAKGDRALLDELTRAAKQIAAELRTATGPKPEPKPEPVVAAPVEVSASPSTPSGHGWIPAAAGGAALAAGAVLLGASKYESDQLTGGDGAGKNVSTLSLSQAQHAEANENTYQIAGLACLAAGAVGVGLAAYSYISSATDHPRVTVAPLLGTPGAVVSGVFP